MMNMSMSKTSSNRDSENLQYRDLPPILLITGRIMISRNWRQIF